MPEPISTRRVGTVPPELRGREVGVRALLPLWDAFRAKGHAPHRLADGTGYSVQHLMNPRERISWAAFVQYMSNLGKVIDDGELAKLGASVVDTPVFRALLSPGRLLFSLSRVYLWVFGPTGPALKMFVAQDIFVEEVGPGHLTLELRMRPGYTPSRENFVLLKGFLAGLSQALGAKRAEITFKTLPLGAAYDIRVSDRPGALGYIRRRAAWLAAAKATAEELLRTNEELHERFVELQREIDARKAAEEGLRRGHEELLATLNSIGDGVIATDASGRVTRMNPVAEALTGWSLHEARGRDIIEVFEIINEDTRRPVQSLVDRVLREGVVIDLADHTVLRARDGLERPIADSGAPIRDAAGSLRGVVLVFRDQTGERKAERAREESEERYRATFEQAAVGVARVAPDGRWLDVNQRLCDIVGYARDELLRSTFQDITYPADLDADLEHVRQMLAGAIATYTMEKRYIRKDGTLVWIDLTVSLVRHASGDPKYFISVVQDISARKQAQDDLARTTSSLQAEVAERKRAEQALRESEESLATTLDSIGDGLIATDPAGCVVRMNPIGETLTGWSLREARGKSIVDVFQIMDEDTRRPVESPVDLVLREGAVVGLANHTVLRGRDGVERPIADSGAPIRDAQGSIRGVVLVFRDQTEERAAERALRESEARKGAILEAALDCIVTANQGGVITEFNPAAEKTFGYARAEALGRPFAEILIPPSLRKQHADGFRRYLDTGVGPVLGKRVELTALRSDGTEFPVELAVVPTRAHDTLFFTAYIRDLTERNKARAALELSEARFRHLADSGIIGIIIADTLGNIHEANDAYLRSVGYSRDEVVAGQVRWADMTPPEWTHLDEVAIEQLKTSGVAKAWEKEYIRKDGTRMPILMGVAMLDAPRCIAFVLDLTEQKRAEEARARALAMAMKESGDRERAENALRETAEQLRQSQKIEAIGTLAGGIAHDFNNLLSVILGYGQLLLAALRPGDPMHADIEEITNAGKRAQELTRQLLAFSRQQVLQPKVVNLNEAMSAMTRMLGRIIGEDIELTFLPAPNLGTVHVDPSQIEQVILNLVVNARDAMPRGGKVTIETAEVDLDSVSAGEHLGIEPGRYVALSVTDTGTGMDRATQARIFDPFFSTKEKGKGTGLGLSTVYGIVKQSGGGVLVQSEQGKGSTFKIYLPRNDSGSDSSDRPTPPPTTLRGSETVLLVEDDEQVRSLTLSILRRHGYDVVAAATGGDALLICKSHAGTIHLLLTDIVMPQMSGRELWERLAPLRPEMKVLFMSGYTDDAIVRHGALSAELAFIQKPLMPAALLAKLRQVLDG